MASRLEKESRSIGSPVRLRCPPRACQIEMFIFSLVRSVRLQFLAHKIRRIIFRLIRTALGSVIENYMPFSPSRSISRVASLIIGIEPRISSRTPRN